MKGKNFTHVQIKQSCQKNIKKQKSTKSYKNSIFIAILIIITFTIYSFMAFMPEFNYVSATSQTISTDIGAIDSNLYPKIKEQIEVLKSKYPNWKFKILYTNLNWSDVISGEYQGHGSSPKNLVPYTNNYKGNWICSICGENHKYDNGTWRCASESAIAYMMDPRNSLNESDIFQFEELSADSADINIVKNMTNGTFLQGHEQGLVDTALNNKVNAYYIVARLIQEQGKGGSALVSGSNGYYNAFNIGASGSTTAEIIANGLAYAQRKGWDTLEKSIEGGIGFVANEYIKKGQNTLYLQKFNVTDTYTYSHQYQQNLMAAQKEGETLKNTYVGTNTLNSSHTFIIPVYKNMPENGAARPDGSVKPKPPVEADLVKINVDGSLKVRKTPENSQAIAWLWNNEIVTRLEKATTKINGTYWDKIRKADGTEGYAARETFDYEEKYKLYLVPVGEGNNSNNGKVKLDSEKIQIIVKPEVIAKDILDFYGKSVKIVKSNKENLDNEQSIIGTGYIVEDKYTVVKKGDVNGDGIINSADLLAIQKHLLKVKNLDGTVYATSGDMNNDGILNSADLLKIQKYLLGVSTIEI